MAVFFLIVTILLAGALFSVLRPYPSPVYAQAPTVDVATVTSTPGGPMVTVRANEGLTQVNLRSGPGTEYEKVGVLLVGQQAPAKGRSPGGLWVLIEYPGIPGDQGWVYSANVDITSGALPVVEPPPTVTPEITLTIDPTLAAQFIVTSQATRLPTFTEPAPIVVPTFRAVDNDNSAAGMPVGMIIIILGGIGLLFGLISVVQSR
jgi:uncharacterized protein YraI